jgi:two-component system LytT family sensor kinase
LNKASFLKKNRTFIVHIIAWICFFSIPFIYRSRTEEIFGLTDNMIASYITINAFLFAFYYFNALVLIPRFFKPGKWMIYALSVVFCFVLFVFVPKPLANAIAEPENAEAFYKNRNIPRPPGAETQFEKRKNITPYRSYYFGFALVFVIGLTVVSIQEWVKSEETKKEMEKEKLNTELSLLKSQINPHFFFNTLNNIYSLAIVKSDQTAASIPKLSSIMRYVLTETDKPLVPLANEIEFLRNYINLQSVRLTDKVKINLDLDEYADDKNVAPLLFIAFVENAFKYGVSTVESSTICISLKTIDNKIRFFAQNHIIRASQNSIVNTGIGIVNVKRRLELLYPGKHELAITDKNDLYTVNLEIALV